MTPIQSSLGYQAPLLPGYLLWARWRPDLHKLFVLVKREEQFRTQFLHSGADLQTNLYVGCYACQYCPLRPAFGCRYRKAQVVSRVMLLLMLISSRTELLLSDISLTWPSSTRGPFPWIDSSGPFWRPGKGTLLVFLLLHTNLLLS